jgi:hypothetical protein
MKTKLIPFINGVQISTDKEERVSLTDLFKSSGKDRNYNPNEWLNQATTKSFIDAVCQIHNTTIDRIIKTKKGKGGGTYTDKQVALAYAKYLSPELHVIVNQTFFERIEEQKNPQLAIDRAVLTWQKQGKSEEWIKQRLNSKGTRLMFTGALKEAGVSGDGYGKCTNAIYEPLFEANAKELRETKSLPEKANTRESMTYLELKTVELAEFLATENIKKLGVTGNRGCEKECRRSSEIISSAVQKALR